MTRFIETDDNMLINVNEIVSIQVDNEGLSDSEIRLYAHAHNITFEEAVFKTEDIFRNFYFICLTNGKTVKTFSIDYESPETEDLRSFLNK